jgi:CheY-like chemotaxis protein
MEETTADKRKSKRVPYHETVIVNGSIEVHCNDISEGGLFVHLSKSLLAGSTVTIQFPGNPVKFEAVVQVIPGSGGMGLMFSSVDDTHCAAVREIIAEAERVEAQQKEQPTVLIVEGNESVRKLNVSRLATDGFTVLEAADGMEALKLLNTSTPDAVILELEAKRVDGLGVLEFIRSSPPLKNVPVMVISSAASAEDKAKALEAGASVFLQKTTTPPAKISSIARKMLAGTAAGS